VKIKSKKISHHGLEREQACAAAVDARAHSVERRAVVVLLILAPLDKPTRLRLVHELLSTHERIMHAILFTGTAGACSVCTGELLFFRNSVDKN
jgi:hypothetical protein